MINNLSVYHHKWRCLPTCQQLEPFMPQSSFDQRPLGLLHQLVVCFVFDCQKLIFTPKLWLVFKVLLNSNTAVLLQAWVAAL